MEKVELVGKGGAAHFSRRTVGTPSNVVETSEVIHDIYDGESIGYRFVRKSRVIDKIKASKEKKEKEN